MEQEKLFEIFKIAIDKEHEACEFYTKAAQNTKDAEAKTLFEKFALVELEHERALQETYRRMKEKYIV
ncbi:MAG: ferritin family protein [Nitrospirota bacterium]